MDDGAQELTQTSDGPSRRWAGLDANQWAILVVMGGLIVAIGAMLALVLRSGWVGLAYVQPTAVASSDTLVLGMPRDVVPTAGGLYWPPKPVPLATPSAPDEVLWWDARYAYRRAVRFDRVAMQSPTGTWARVILDGGRAQREGRMRTDGADVRVLVWDGGRWWEIPRLVRPLSGTVGWELIFQLQDTAHAPPVDGAQRYVYTVYYGHPFAGAPPIVKEAPDARTLLLELGEQEGVEWGPEVIWRADAGIVQTLVSLDGRMLIQCQPGALQEDTRVRLRTVPLSEKSGRGPLPDFELHADPPPGPPGSDNVVRWNPPLAVTINWAGLEVDAGYLETWAYFAYDMDQGRWHSVPVDFDPEQGVIRFTTDQL